MLGSFGMWTVCGGKSFHKGNLSETLSGVSQPCTIRKKEKTTWGGTSCDAATGHSKYAACIVILIKSLLGTAYGEFYRIFIMYERLCCHRLYTSLSCGVLCTSLSTLENFARHSWPSPCWRWRMPKGEWIQQMTPCARPFAKQLSWCPDMLGYWILRPDRSDISIRSNFGVWRAKPAAWSNLVLWAMFLDFQEPNRSQQNVTVSSMYWNLFTSF